MKPKDFVFIVVLGVFEGLVYFGSHFRNLLSAQIFITGLVIGGISLVLWIMLRVEENFEQSDSACPNCGNWTRKGAKFCGKCGKRMPSGNPVSLILDVIFFRWVITGAGNGNINENARYSWETEAKPYDSESGLSREQTSVKEPPIDAEKPAEISYGETFICEECGFETREQTDFCVKCSGKMRSVYHAPANLSEADKEFNYGEIRARYKDAFDNIDCTFWDRVFHSRYNRTASMLEKAGKEVQALGYAEESKKILDKALQIRTWDLIWTVIYIAGVFLLYLITGKHR